MEKKCGNGCLKKMWKDYLKHRQGSEQPGLIWHFSEKGDDLQRSFPT